MYVVYFAQGAVKRVQVVHRKRGVQLNK